MPEPGAKTVALGRTHLSVSKLCFGTSALGDMPDTYGYGVDEHQAKETIRTIFAGPVNFLDTSRNYGLGRSEERIGAVIRERGGLPAGFVLSTKLDRDPETGRFDAAQARRSLEESLAALGLKQVHLLHLHDPEHAASLDEITSPDGALRELFKMRDEGLATAVGLAAGRIDVMMPLLRDWDFDALITHNRYTLVNRNAEPMIDFAHAKGIAILNAAPYGSGILAKGSDQYARYAYQDAASDRLAPIHRLEAVCRQHNIPLGALALQFSLRDPRITSTICGVSRPERIAQTLEWAQRPIPDLVWSELSSVPATTEDPEATRHYKLG
jgi:D-threo-aldose 1-dehydrogenase